VSIAHSTKKVDAGRIPGPAAVPNVVEIQLAWTGANARIFHNYLHASFAGSVTLSVAIANTVFSAISSGWNTNLALYSPTTCNMLRATVRDMTATTNPIFVSTAAAVAGTSASPGMPANVALVLTEQATQRGRGMKGRIFVPCWATNADASGGQALAAVQTAMNAFGTAIFNAMTAQSWTPCVAKPARQAYIGYSGASHNARAASSVQISGYTCQDLFWDSQRPRIKP
jgi:hypothetical protein